MHTIDASELLRPGLLRGVSILLAGMAPAPADGDDDASLGAAVRAACAALGARVCECELGAAASSDQGDAASGEQIERVAEDAVAAALADGHGVELLVVDCASVFARASDDGARESLRVCLDVAWNVTRPVLNGAFLASGRGGRIVYLAPPADGREHAGAARSGLENLARTLSIEWARHGVGTVTIASGLARAGEVAALTAYLASPAGAYFSGCVLDLGRARESPS